MKMQLVKHKSWYGFGLLAAVAVLISSYAWFSVGTLHYDSPDETANALFTRQFAKHKTLSVCTQYAKLDRLAPIPRSVSVYKGCLIPGSFFGQAIIYGIIVGTIGMGALPWLIALVTVAALGTLFVLFHQLGGLRLAVLSVTIAAIQPAWLLFASRPLFHNILFADLLIFTITCLLLAKVKNNVRWYALSGIFAGLAISVRASEALWIFPILLFVTLLGPKRSWRGFSFGACFLFLSLLPTLYWNTSLYGAPWRTAYTLSVEAGAQQTYSIVSKFVLPFGIHPVAALHVAWQYVIVLAPWFGIFFLVGILIALRRFRSLTTGKRWYIVVYLLASIWLILYYGSWGLTEYIDPSAIFLSSSYTRYWLPLYVFGAPFIAIGVEWFVYVFFSGRFWLLRSVALCMAILVLTVHLVYRDPLFGLIPVRQRIVQYDEFSRTVDELLRPSDIIIAGYHDKLFFPDHAVVVRLPDNVAERHTFVQTLRKIGSLYIFVSETDEPTVSGRKLLEQDGNTLQQIASTDDGILYRIIP